MTKDFVTTWHPPGRFSTFGKAPKWTSISSSLDSEGPRENEELEGPASRPIGEYPSFENLPDGRILAAYDDGKPIWSVVYNILQEE